jgi:hypothetical protein
VQTASGWHVADFGRSEASIPECADFENAPVCVFVFTVWIFVPGTSDGCITFSVAHGDPRPRAHEYQTTYIYIIRLRGKWIHGHIVDTWTCSRNDSWNMGTVWQFDTDQYAIRHNSSHGKSMDSMRGGSVSLFSNLATTEISSDYMVTGTHGFLLVTYYRALSVIDYVNVTCRALWRVYQCST